MPTAILNVIATNWVPRLGLSRHFRGRGQAVAALALALAASPAAADDAATYDLRPQFTAGRTSQYEFWAQRDLTATTHTGELEHTVMQQSVFEGAAQWTVDNVQTNGAATCTMTIQWMTVTQIDPQGNEQKADSRKTSSDLETLHKLLRAMAGRPIRFDVEPDGRIAKVRGADAVRKQLDESLADAVDDQYFIEIAYGLALLPGAPKSLQRGDTWSFPFTSGLEMGELQLDTTLQLAGVESIADIPIAQVTGQADLQFVPHTDRLPPSDQVRIHFKLTDDRADSNTLWDLLRHEIAGQNSTVSFTLQMTMRLGDRQVVQTIDQTTQSQVLRIAEDD